MKTNRKMRLWITWKPILLWSLLMALVLGEACMIGNLCFSFGGIRGTNVEFRTVGAADLFIPY